jgi:hypothetical protein
MASADITRRFHLRTLKEREFWRTQLWIGRCLRRIKRLVFHRRRSLARKIAIVRDLDLVRVHRNFIGLSRSCNNFERDSGYIPCDLVNFQAESSVQVCWLPQFSLTGRLRKAPDQSTLSLSLVVWLSHVFTTSTRRKWMLEPCERNLLCRG